MPHICTFPSFAKNIKVGQPPESVALGLGMISDCPNILRLACWSLGIGTPGLDFCKFSLFVPFPR